MSRSGEDLRLRENLRALAGTDPRTAEAVAALPAGGTAGIEARDPGTENPSLLVDGVYVHGRHAPARDAEAHVRREVDPSATAVIVIGFGLGYPVEAVRRAFPSLPVLVVEPDAGLFAAALGARDLRHVLSDAAVHWCVGGEPGRLPALLEELPTARPALLPLRSVVRLRPGTYRPFEETIHSWLLRRDINVNTLNRFGRLWVRNLCRNIVPMARCAGIGDLRGLFEGVPALVLAGGPSLDSVLAFLPALRERMLVVCVNTPLRAVRECGVEPDFTVVVDPQFWASRALDWTAASHGVLVAEPSTCPRVFRKPTERFFLCSSLFPLGETLEEAAGRKGHLGAGGSVSTSAWDLARFLGARPLYAAGLDLGFPGMRAHCKGSYAESLWSAESGRLSPLEDSAFRSVRDIGLFPVRSTDGGSTPTDRRMLLYKWWFENQLRIDPGLECRTLSPRGVRIEGMPAADVRELLSLPAARARIDQGMRRVREIHDDESRHDSTRAGLRRALGELARQLGNLEDLGARGLSANRELSAAIGRGQDTRTCVAELDRIDQAILELPARSIAGFLVQGVIHGIVGEGEKPAGAQEVAARSEAIYAGVAESSRWQRLLIERAARELDLDGEGGPRSPARQ
ncbi:MAG TPA: 6-hydroxymethylpterin diphosphokinase MptE-like protein [Spirochaetia bacterium]|nr:6-hydroxymethylpterin diphosphokinase MptE-like protein [Spirochaetia bacterium]